MALGLGSTINQHSKNILHYVCKKVVLMITVPRLPLDAVQKGSTANDVIDRNSECTVQTKVIT
eukprot:3220330-Amphidinium_carterae.1